MTVLLQFGEYDRTRGKDSDMNVLLISEDHAIVCRYGIMFRLQRRRYACRCNRCRVRIFLQFSPEPAKMVVLKSREIKTVQVHDLAPHGNKIA